MSGTDPGSPSKLTDQELLALGQSGVSEYLEVLIKRHYPSVARYFSYHLGDSEAARDLAQDTFLDALLKLDRLDADRPFAPWLFRAAYFNLLRERRRRAVRRYVSLDRLLSLNTGRFPKLMVNDVSGIVDEREIIEQTLADLAPKLREALLLHRLEGFTGPEVGQILGISSAAAWKRINRAQSLFEIRYRQLCGEQSEQQVRSSR